MKHIAIYIDFLPILFRFSGNTLFIVVAKQSRCYPRLYAYVDKSWPWDAVRPLFVSDQNFTTGGSIPKHAVRFQSEKTHNHNKYGK